MKLSSATSMKPYNAAGGDSLSTGRTVVEAQLRAILIDVLQVDQGVVASLNARSGLFGSLPEIDSMAVANLITAIEDRFDITIDDDDVDGEMLETFGGLTAFVEHKLTGS